MRRRRRRNPPLPTWVALLAGSVLTGVGWVAYSTLYPPKTLPPKPGAQGSITLPTGQVVTGMVV